MVNYNSTLWIILVGLVIITACQDGTLVTPIRVTGPSSAKATESVTTALPAASTEGTVTPKPTITLFYILTYTPTPGVPPTLTPTPEFSPTATPTPTVTPTPKTAIINKQPVSIGRLFSVLPNNDPNQLQYPHQDIFTEALRERLDLTVIPSSNRPDGTWFDLVYASPTGQWLIYFKQAEEIKYAPYDIPLDLDIWLARADGEQAQRLIANVYDGFHKYIRWSNNSRYVSLGISDWRYGPGFDYYWIDLETGQSKQLDENEYPLEVGLYEDPNSFHSNTPILYDEIGIQLYDAPTVSPNGNIIAFSYEYSRQLILIDIEREQAQLYDIELAASCPIWSVDGATLYFFDTNQTLWAFELSTAQLTPLAIIPAEYTPDLYNTFRWLLYPDEKRFVIPSHGEVLIGQY